MHGVTAAEEHRKRHPGPIVMGAGRFGILSRIDIRFHDVAKIVHVIPKHSRDMVRVFPEDSVLAGRRSESRFASRYGRFADEMLALVKIGALVGDADHNLRRAGNAVAIPVTLGRSGGRAHRLGRRSVELGATGHKSKEAEGKCSSKKRLANHWMRRVMRPVPGSIKDLISERRLWQEKGPGVIVVLAPRAAS